MKFLLADDHSIVRMDLRLIIENAFPEAHIEEAENGNGVMEKTKHAKFSLCILDFQMPDTNILGVISYALTRDDEAKILIYTMASEKLYAPKLFRTGVNGFLSKEAENSEITKGIKTILIGEFYPNEDLAITAAAQEATGKAINPFSILSAKEMDILNYLIKGKNTKEISTLSNLQMSTISTHKIRIFRKLNVSNMAELIELAKEYNL